MRDSRNLLSGKRKYLYGALLLTFISLICVAFRIADNRDFDIARREVLLRRIGHEVLLQSGDSTSRVLPVKKISENEYQISFENALTFHPDLMVNTTQRLLAQDPLADKYVVNVVNCSDASVAYGYAVSKNKKDDIVACLGRKQPTACYRINIKFEPTGIITARDGYFLSGLSLLALCGFVFWRRTKTPATLPDEQDQQDSVVLPVDLKTDKLTFGSITFDADARKLLMNGNSIDLTKTENRVLLMFASSPNEIIERSRLQKEIWEDEGVIVGRSLDMFISKLRKKLEVDPDVKIVVVRGKGYKLAIGA